MQKTIGLLSGLLVVLVVGGALMYLAFQDRSDLPLWGDDSYLQGNLIYFTQDECDFCQDVTRYINEEGDHVEDRLTTHNIDTEGKQDFQDAAGKCGLSPRRTQAPFLWDGEAEECYQQAPEIIDFLHEKK
jgi:glutaredoxin